MIKRGFILGKFLPPHEGHLWLCRAAAQLVDELTVLVCSLDREPIPGQIRYDWMKTLLPNCRIVWYSKDAPQEQSDDPKFWDIWREICQEVHPEKLDYVFGSEDYITRLAQELEAEPVIMDPRRLAVPVSGRDVRENPAKQWAFIPQIVRPYFQKRIVLFGPESVGKTTLASALAQYFNTLYVPEYGRTYTEVDEPDFWTVEDHKTIAARHRAMRKALEPIAGPILFEDTDPLLTCVWQEMLTGKRAEWVEDVTLADLYLFLDTDIGWVDDGTRYFDRTDEQNEFAAKCREILDRVGANYTVVGGDGDARLEAAKDAVQTFILR